MKLTKEEVLTLAQLSRLELTEEELEQYASELTSILTYVAQLQAVDVSHVNPVKQISGLSGVLRKDRAEQTFSRKEMLASAPKASEDMIEVPQVIKK